MVLKKDIHRFISTTELFLSDIRGLRNTGLKKVNFFVGHPVAYVDPFNYQFIADYFKYHKPGIQNDQD